VHQQSRFPLVGVHSTVDCYQCHKSETFLRFEVIGNECYSCHSDVYLATTQPNHKQSGFSTLCTECHSIYSQNWASTNFNHNFFPLSKGHEGVSCLKCHTNGQFTKVSTDCSTCHLSDYNGTTNPNHQIANFPKTCTDCHTTSPGWKPTTFNHSSFPLTQGHDINDCSKCHANGNYSKLPTDCISCHQKDYNSAANPNHIAANFSTNCTLCHTTSPGWQPASFNHTNFPLTQGHNINDCTKCHLNNNYTNTSSSCISCHQTDYNSTTNPNHLTANFPTTCNACHTTAPGWKPATFNHSSFPLTQGHSISDCAKCHVNGNYSSVSKECITCHQTDYNATSNPQHSALNFSTVCTQCHTTNPGWKPASYTLHDALSFPIYSGKHRGQWSSCIDCHSNTSNYKAFSCTNCHEHNKADMDSKHRGQSNYSYISSACLQCHPRGSSK
jgi:hypothetical protein